MIVSCLISVGENLLTTSNLKSTNIQYEEWGVQITKIMWFENCKLMNKPALHTRVILIQSSPEYPQIFLYTVNCRVMVSKQLELCHSLEHDQYLKACLWFSSVKPDFVGRDRKWMKMENLPHTQTLHKMERTNQGNFIYSLQFGLCNPRMT